MMMIGGRKQKKLSKFEQKLLDCQSRAVMQPPEFIYSPSFHNFLPQYPEIYGNFDMSYPIANYQSTTSRRIRRRSAHKNTRKEKTPKHDSSNPIPVSPIVNNTYNNNKNTSSTTHKTKTNKTPDQRRKSKKSDKCRKYKKSNLPMNNSFREFRLESDQSAPDENIDAFSMTPSFFQNDVDYYSNQKRKNEIPNANKGIPAIPNLAFKRNRTKTNLKSKNNNNKWQSLQRTNSILSIQSIASVQKSRKQKPKREILCSQTQSIYDNHLKKQTDNADQFYQINPINPKFKNANNNINNNNNDDKPEKSKPGQKLKNSKEIKFNFKPSSTQTQSDLTGKPHNNDCIVPGLATFGQLGNETMKSDSNEFAKICLDSYWVTVVGL